MDNLKDSQDLDVPKELTKGREGMGQMITKDGEATTRPDGIHALGGDMRDDVLRRGTGTAGGKDGRNDHMLQEEKDKAGP